MLQKDETSGKWLFHMKHWKLAKKPNSSQGMKMMNDYNRLSLFTFHLYSYEVMRSCWDQEPNRRPSFREVGEMLKGLLSELPELEASQEASYINQGLEIAAAAAAASLETQTDTGGKWGNVYLHNPVGAAAPREDDNETEGGYLKYSSDLA